MKKAVANILLWSLGVALAVLAGYLVTKSSGLQAGGQTEPVGTRVDTLYVHDTITVKKPVSVTKWKIDSVPYPVGDTVRVHDTLYVYLEREQVRWEDSLSVVYASGILPEVDSVIHYTQGRTVIQQIPVVKKPKFGIGIQVGYGVTLDQNVVRCSPYVGIGGTYNLATW